MQKVQNKNEKFRSFKSKEKHSYERETVQFCVINPRIPLHIDHPMAIVQVHYFPNNVAYYGLAGFPTLFLLFQITRFIFKL